MRNDGKPGEFISKRSSDDLAHEGPGCETTELTQKMFLERTRGSARKPESKCACVRVLCCQKASALSRGVE